MALKLGNFWTVVGLEIRGNIGADVMGGVKLGIVNGVVELLNVRFGVNDGDEEVIKLSAEYGTCWCSSPLERVT